MLDSTLPLWLRLQRYIAAAWPFLRYCAARFREDRGFNAAGVLAYATLLSIVPLMAVGLSIFSAFPVFKGLQAALENFVFQNFVPAAGQVVQQYLQQFAAKATRLTAAGLVVLILSALMVMASVDSALNRIWRVQRPRSLLNAFLVYGAVLTWGPVLLGVALGVSSYVMALPLLKDAGHAGWLLRGLPLLLTAVAFTLLYLVVPQRSVRWRHALAGGLLAALLFELAKRAFAAYVATVPAYEAVYGAFAAVPVFLVWLYVSWLIILFGAEFSACLHLYRPRPHGAPAAGLGFVHSLMLLDALWLAQREGRALGLRQLEDVVTDLNEDELRELLTRLQQHSLVLRTLDGRYALARDLAEVNLMQVYRSGEYPLPARETLILPVAAGNRWARTLTRQLAGVEEQMDNVLSLPLKQLFEPPAEPPEPLPAP